MDHLAASLARMSRAERAKLTDEDLTKLGLDRDDLDYDTDPEAVTDVEDEDEPEEKDDKANEDVLAQTETGSSNAGTSNKGKGVDRGVAEDLSSLTTAQRELLDFLDEVNGQDAYSNEDAALGKVNRREYLVLPTGFTAPRVAAKDVGDSTVFKKFTKLQLAQIYALNKAAAPDGTDAKRYAMLRMESVKMGWVSGQREIRRETPPAEAMNIFLTDIGEERDNLARYRTAAFLIPLVAEHTFRTMGHHYLTGEAASYEKRYQDTLRACLAVNVHGLLASGVQYHSLFHWVSPLRAREVLMSQLSTTRIPDALAIRANAAPAGTALVTTTAAVLSAMRAADLFTEFKTAGNFDFDIIESVTKKVKQAPTTYHKTFYAYGVVAPTVKQREDLDKAKAEAGRFAPVAQAFIDAMFQDSALNNAKALKKHANDNPVLMRRAQKFFRALSRKEARNISELFVRVAEE
jgi:hypothetical protein